MKTRCFLLALLVGLVFAVPLAPALAAPVPRLDLHTFTTPTSFSAADTAGCLASLDPVLSASACDEYQLTVSNTGQAPTSGAAIALTDVLPAGLAVVATEADLKAPGRSKVPLEGDCKVEGTTTVACRFPLRLQPDERLELLIAVEVTAAAGGGQNVVTLSGGGAPGAEASEPVPLDSPPSFGLSAVQSLLSEPGGEPDQLAGDHPYEYVTRLDLNNTIRDSSAATFQATSVEDVRDVVLDLPPGLVGAATATPYCTLAQLASIARCPADTRVGQIFTEPLSNASVNSAIYNIFPEAGVAAEFGFADELDNVHVIYSSVVPSPAGYVLRASTPEVPQIPLTDAIVTFFGNPAAKNATTKAAEAQALSTATPMFTGPADCSGAPLQTHIYMDGWQDPGALSADGGPDLADPAWVKASSEAPPVGGCEGLSFAATLSATPETERADSPSGLEVDLAVPPTTGAEERATPPLRDAVITLPEGLVVDPSSANGLGACSLAQVGISASGEPDAAPPACPDASKLGTVELETPALPAEACRREAGEPQFRNLAECPQPGERESVPLEGQVYLARQGENPFGSLLAIYIVVDDPRTGVVVKLAGEVVADPTTGRLTTTVTAGPQFPFSELRTHFFGGARAALRTPATCGSYEVSSQLTPWSAPQSGPPATPGAGFGVSQAAGPGACPTTPSHEPNHPACTAGTVNPQAGAYSTFVVHGARADGDQPITQVNLTLPKGLVGKLAGVPYCPEGDLALAHSRERLGGGAEELARPSCPAASQVGVARVGAGAGPEPFYVSGHAYLAGPYKGAPLSLAIVTPALAGPFDLGDVVVRAALDVDPFTTEISAVSDPIPTILHGIPLDIRSINLEMNRPRFTLNPTNCERSAITGDALGQFGTDAPLFAPFQVAGCKALAFRPKLRVSLKGPTKRTGHPALKAEVTYPQGPGYANIAYAQVGLPGTEFLDQGNLNHVCTQAELKSASCPKSSIYGTAKAWTPLLEKPLEGNVYLGVGFGHKLPDLVAELDGQIRVLLHGKVDTDKQKGIRNTFEVVPDAPVSRFVLSMKGGPRYGLLENTEGVCARPQRAAVKFIAQNGILRSYRQRIENGCGKKSTRAKKHGSDGKGAKAAGKHRRGSKTRSGTADRAGQKLGGR
jgi:hypothetical protein